MREKAIFEAIKAVAIVREDRQFSDIQLKMVASGPARDEAERYTRKYALDCHVKLIGSLFGTNKIRFVRSRFPLTTKRACPATG